MYQHKTFQRMIEAADAAFFEGDKIRVCVEIGRVERANETRMINAAFAAGAFDAFEDDGVVHCVFFATSDLFAQFNKHNGIEIVESAA
jgi:hypothetical protein